MIIVRESVLTTWLTFLLTGFMLLRMLLYLDVRLRIVTYTYLVVPLFILHLYHNDLLHWDIWLVRRCILRLMPGELLLFFVSWSILTFISVFLCCAFNSIIILWNVLVIIRGWQILQLVVESIGDYSWRICEVVLEEQIRLLACGVNLFGILQNFRIDAVWCLLASKYSLLISSRLLFLFRKACLFIKHVNLGGVRLHVKVFYRVSYSPILLFAFAWSCLHWCGGGVLDLLLRLSLIHGWQL